MALHRPRRIAIPPQTPYIPPRARAGQAIAAGKAGGAEHSAPVGARGRKVRAPQGRVVGNADRG